MLAVALALAWRLAIFFAAGVGAGVANAVAGGGTFITFPTLLALGVPALQANMSTTVGVGPSFLASLRVYRHELRAHWPLLRALAPATVVGTLSGCALLLRGSPGTFRLVVPWLIGTGTVLFAAAPWITRRLAHVDHRHPARRRALFAGVFAISLYGGYFGAGLGILLLALTALTLPYDVHELQVLRSALSLLITMVAAVVFLLHGHLAVQAVLMLVAGTLVGGWLGAWVVKRLSAAWVRALVITLGVVTTLRLAI
ncbi:MAG: sulfite exporter TauE/SafE family protein [Acidobacteriota bacterium]|nr:sulfite exporter TauE/SafE family protein [Acidobacteriota bacterium]MDE3106592.1 sulfite exporter TauE/SafE family protein [Acidobacteriota bacterium]